MSFDSKLQRIFSDHIEQMSKDLEKISNGEDQFVFKIYERNLLISICEKVSELFKKEPIVLNLKGDCVVVGDLHGHILDLYRIFTVFDLPPRTTYLFLGDIIDRGGFSIESITLLFVLKLLYPSNIFIIRGNHEFNTISEKEKEKELKKIDLKNLNSFVDQISQVYGQRNHILPQKNPKIYLGTINEHSSEKFDITEDFHSSYGFPVHMKHNSHSFHMKFNNNNDGSSINHSNSLIDENDPIANPSNILQKNSHPSLAKVPHGFTNRLYTSFCSAFSYMPLAARFGEKIFCIHGGIGGNISNIEKDIVPLERPITNYDNPIIENLLWSDPMPPEKEKEYKTLNFMTSPRGRGCIFGKAPLDSFMYANRLSLLIRAHEVVDSGIRLQFNNRLITIFSASSYINSYNNNSGVLKISADCKVTTYSFPPFKFLPRESASFVLNNSNNNKCIGQQSIFASSSSFFSSISSTSNINNDFSNSLNIPYVINSNNNNESKKNDVNDDKYDSGECYTIDNFYNVNMINNISGTKTNNDRNTLTKIISKTLIANNRKQNFPSHGLCNNQDQTQNSTRRRIKFESKNAKKSLSECTANPTFS